jgi:hypothetical protein
VSSNEYGADELPTMIRGFHRFHTTDMGWPDVAYNFLVDRFGRIWEARAGSLAGAVAGFRTIAVNKSASTNRLNHNTTITYEILYAVERHERSGRHYPRGPHRGTPAARAGGTGRS